MGDPLDVGLFVEILDSAALLFEEGNSELTATFLSYLLALCIQHVRYVGARVQPESLQSLQASIKDLQSKQRLALGFAKAEGLTHSTEKIDGRYADLHIE